MGIDFTWEGEDEQDIAHWAYGGFMRFRKKLASEIGINMDEMTGFGGERKWDNIQDNIKPLLDHSDCDGELSPEECQQVSSRLKELVKEWDDDYDKQQALILARNMEECNKLDTELIFC